MKPTLTTDNTAPKINVSGTTFADSLFWDSGIFWDSGLYWDATTSRGLPSLTIDSRMPSLTIT